MKLNRTMMPVLLGALLVASAGAEDYFQQGNAELQNSNYREAARLYGLYLAGHPNDINSLFNRGLAYADLQVRDTAIADFSRVIELNPDDTAAYVLRGVQYYHGAAINNMAEEMAQRLFAEDDDTVYVPADSARLAFDPALADFNKAISLDSTDANPYKMRGSCHAELKDYGDAVADFTTAIRLKPDFERAFSERGDAYMALARYPDAVRDYTRLIELTPESESWVSRGKAHQANQEYEKAVSDFTRALEFDSTAGPVYNRRGNCYYSLNRLDAAKQDWQKAHRLNDYFPDSPEGKRALITR